MDCKKSFVNGLNDSCFYCVNFQKCIAEYARWFDKDRAECMDKVNIIGVGNEWDIYYADEFIYAVDDGCGSIGDAMSECEDMCEVISYAKEIIECSVNDERREAGKNPLSDKVLSAIIARLAETWCIHYDVKEV